MSRCESTHFIGCLILSINFSTLISDLDHVQDRFESWGLKLVTVSREVEAHTLTVCSYKLQMTSTQIVMSLAW